MVYFIPLLKCHGALLDGWFSPDPSFNVRPQEPVAVEGKEDVTSELLEKGCRFLPCLDCVSVLLSLIRVLSHLKIDNYKDLSGSYKRAGPKNGRAIPELNQ